MSPSLDVLFPESNYALTGLDMPADAVAVAARHKDIMMRDGRTLAPIILPGAWALGEGMDVAYPVSEPVYMSGSQSPQPSVWCALMGMAAGALDYMGLDEYKGRSVKASSPSSASVSCSSSFRCRSGRSSNCGLADEEELPAEAPATDAECDFDLDLPVPLPIHAQVCAHAKTD